MYCPECGHHNRESARFCGRCGASLIELTEGEATVSFTPPAEPGADSGVREAVVEGAPPSVKAIEYPTTNQSTVTRQVMAKLCMMVARTFFLRTMPP